MKIKILITGIIITAFYFSGCGTTITSTSDRFKRTAEDIEKEPRQKSGKEQKEAVEEKRPELTPKYASLKEDFDITSYKIKPEINEQSSDVEENKPEVWTEFEKADSSPKTNVAKSFQGYRVQIMTTDNLDEANSVKSDVFFKTNQPVYVIFDAPFYKVRAGDFTELTSARTLNFKLIQLGFKEARVVPDSVNVVK